MDFMDSSTIFFKVNAKCSQHTQTFPYIEAVSNQRDHLQAQVNINFKTAHSMVFFARNSQVNLASMSWCHNIEGLKVINTQFLCASISHLPNPSLASSARSDVKGRTSLPGPGRRKRFACQIGLSLWPPDLPANTNTQLCQQSD